MFFYPSEDADPRLVPIRIDGFPHFAADVFEILLFLHRSAGTCASKLIVNGILRWAGRHALVIKETTRRIHNAYTGGADRAFCSPTKDDPLANEGLGDSPTITINLSEWADIGSGSPGQARDEVLFHEMVHAYMLQRGLGNGKSLKHRANPDRVRRFDMSDDFYAVMITNVYASERQRPIRRDHVGFSFLDQTAYGLTLDPAFARYFKALKNHAPDLVEGLSKIDTRFNPWNPRHKLHDLLDAQLY